MILHPTAKIGRDCKIGPNVSIGIECVIEDGARISNSVLLHRVKARPLALAAMHLLPCAAAPRREQALQSHVHEICEEAQYCAILGHVHTNTT